MSETRFFRLNRNGHVAHLELNRPDKANSMNDEFWSELPQLIKFLDDDHTLRALVISGAGRHFCAGLDLSAFEFIHGLATAEPARAALALRQEIRRMQESFTVLEQSRLPVIAAVHGACLGGAIDMICACDIRLAASDTRFAIEEIHVGMAADVGTLQRLPKLIPPGIVKELALTGRRFSAEEAHAWGFVNSIHADAQQTLEAALKLATAIAEHSPVAVAGIKKAIDYTRDHPVADALEQIASWNAAMLKPQDLGQAVNARKQGRLAQFADLLPVN